jgi:hypothetical protein
MGTTARTRNNAPRRGRGSDRATQEEPRDEYDLLTAALLGLLVGAGVTLLLRRGPRGRRPLNDVMRFAGAGAATAGRYAGRYGSRGARWAADRGGDLWDSVSPELESAAEHVGEYVDKAREAIDDVVRREARDLRKAIRRQRKRLGV